MTGSVTTLWARAFVDELARNGVREVVVAPGSRSTPLVMAFAADGRFRMRVHLDERSAAFFALGVGKASGVPAAVVTTSGTATANVFPAVIEASQGETPLLVLTADRPHRLRDSDANQAIDQLRLYGPYASAFFEVGPPTAGDPELRHLRALAGRAVHAAAGPQAGAVHVNFPFDEPLEPIEEHEGFAREHPLAAMGRPDGAPFVQLRAGRRAAPPGVLDSLVATLDSPGGVIVAGPSSDAGRVGPAARRLAAATGFPLLADPLSGGRFGPAEGAHVVGAYDLIMRDDDVRDALTPSVVLRVGASVTSAALQAWLLHHDGVPHVVVDGGGRWKDHGATATEYVHADAAETLTTLADRVERAAAEEWTELWGTAERAALDALDRGGFEPHEGDVLATVASGIPPGGTLFVSSSMPVRDLDAFGRPREEALSVFGNRGASGIDGIVSTAFGVSSQTDQPAVCVLGDVAFFHDQNGLLWSREEDAPMVFVLIDNDGGGIFHMLPIAEHEPHFTEYFAAPHGLDLSHATAMHGVECRDVSIADLASALEDAWGDAVSAARTVVLRVRSERSSNHRNHAAVAAAVTRSVRDALLASN